LEVLGEESKARHWMNGMNAPRDIFDGRSPQELLATGDPTEQRGVLATLIRIDYGVFSSPPDEGLPDASECASDS
jgi:uncharacterized protein (DUF2384 family)